MGGYQQLSLFVPITGTNVCMYITNRWSIILRGNMKTLITVDTLLQSESGVALLKQQHIIITFIINGHWLRHIDNSNSATVVGKPIVFPKRIVCHKKWNEIEKVEHSTVDNLILTDQPNVPLLYLRYSFLLMLILFSHDKSVVTPYHSVTRVHSL